MRKLSLWAKHHPVYARIIIVISHCLLVWIGYFLGMQLSETGIELSPLWLYLFIGIFFITGATYPSKKSRNYFKRKLYDFMVACCSFFMVISVTYQLNTPASVYEPIQATTIAHPSPYKYVEAKKLLEQFKNGEKTKFNSKEKRIIKKEFNYQLLQYAKAKVTGDKTTGEQVALIILTCIAAVGLLYLLAALACTISCNGSDAAAIIVFVLGTAAIIWGLVAVIRSIRRKQKKSK
jgi:uncharacterized membrane protein HdeD (DUF308 family)